MALTPNQIKERLGCRYPWPLQDNFVPTVFSDCVSWEQQVLWLYRFILGVYLELQDEGYITIDEVLEDSPAAVKSSGIWQFVTNGLATLETTLRAAITAGDDKVASDAADALQQAVTTINQTISTLETTLRAAITAGDDALRSLIAELQRQVSTLASVRNFQLVRGDDRLLTFEVSIAGNSVKPYYPTAGAAPNILSANTVITNGDNCVILTDSEWSIYGAGEDVIPAQYYAVLGVMYGDSSRNATLISLPVYVHVLGTARQVQLAVPPEALPDLSVDKYLSVWHPFYNPPA